MDVFFVTDIYYLYYIYIYTMYIYNIYIHMIEDRETQNPSALSPPHPDPINMATAWWVSPILRQIRLGD